MERESSPAIEAELKRGEGILISKGISLLRARAMQRLPLYCIHLARKHNLKNPSEQQLFWLFKRAVGLVLDEIGEFVIAEKAHNSSSIDELTPILKDSFDIIQPRSALSNMLLICKSC